MHLLNSETVVLNATKTNDRLETKAAKYDEFEQLCFDFESDDEFPLIKHIEEKVNLPEGACNMSA